MKWKWIACRTGVRGVWGSRTANLPGQRRCPSGRGIRRPGIAVRLAGRWRCVGELNVPGVGIGPPSRPRPAVEARAAGQRTDRSLLNKGSYSDIGRLVHRCGEVAFSGFHKPGQRNAYEAVHPIWGFTAQLRRFGPRGAARERGHRSSGGRQPTRRQAEPTGPTAEEAPGLSPCRAVQADGVFWEQPCTSCTTAQIYCLRRSAMT